MFLFDEALYKWSCLEENTLKNSAEGDGIDRQSMISCLFKWFYSLVDVKKKLKKKSIITNNLNPSLHGNIFQFA